VGTCCCCCCCRHGSVLVFGFGIQARSMPTPTNAGCVKMQPFSSYAVKSWILDIRPPPPLAFFCIVSDVFHSRSCSSPGKVKGWLNKKEIDKRMGKIPDISEWLMFVGFSHYCCWLLAFLFRLWVRNTLGWDGRVIWGFLFLID
jgi:hypothetical protein